VRVPAITVLVALALAAATPAVAAPGDLDLTVRHTVVALGGDGVTRTTEFSERVHRRQDLVWIERVLPPGAHDAEDHAQRSGEHKHPDLSAAARWITRDPAGIRLRLVLSHDKLILEVPPADRPTVGFDGDWETATRFIRSDALGAMTALSRSGLDGTRWYEQRTPGGTVRVLWDEKDAYPRRVEARNEAGTVVKTSVAERCRAPATPPWTVVGGFQAREYSDVLD
jgi:hypothetical protein